MGIAWFGQSAHRRIMQGDLRIGLSRTGQVGTGPGAVRRPRSEASEAWDALISKQRRVPE